MMGEMLIQYGLPEEIFFKIEDQFNFDLYEFGVNDSNTYDSNTYVEYNDILSIEAVNPDEKRINDPRIPQGNILWVIYTKSLYFYIMDNYEVKVGPRL